MVRREPRDAQKQTCELTLRRENIRHPNVLLFRRALLRVSFARRHVSRAFELQQEVNRAVWVRERRTHAQKVEC